MLVVVIGNSRDLLLRKDGARIDAADAIVRLNSFAIDGFEEYVGTRIDIVSITLAKEVVAGALPHSASLISKARSLWTTSKRANTAKVDIDRAAKVIARDPDDIVFVDDTGDTRAIDQAYSKGQEKLDRIAEPHAGAIRLGLDPGVFRPTTGFLTVFLARARFPDAELCITGFGLNSELSLQRFDTSGNKMWCAHSLDIERDVLNEGIQMGEWRKL